MCGYLRIANAYLPTQFSGFGRIFGLKHQKINKILKNWFIANGKFEGKKNHTHMLYKWKICYAAIHNSKEKKETAPFDFFGEYWFNTEDVEWIPSLGMHTSGNRIG